jgi:hypothetical protein
MGVFPKGTKYQKPEKQGKDKVLSHILQLVSSQLQKSTLLKVSEKNEKLEVGLKVIVYSY